MSRKRKARIPILLMRVGKLHRYLYRVQPPPPPHHQIMCYRSNDQQIVTSFLYFDWMIFILWNWRCFLELVTVVCTLLLLISVDSVDIFLLQMSVDRFEFRPFVYLVILQTSTSTHLNLDLRVTSLTTFAMGPFLLDSYFIKKII